jgi:hypothetical protein
VKRLAATERGGENEPTNPQRGQQPQWRPATENSGIDVHKKEGQLCIITEAGEVLERSLGEVWTPSHSSRRRPGGPQDTAAGECVTPRSSVGVDVHPRDTRSHAVVSAIARAADTRDVTLPVAAVDGSADGVASLGSARGVRDRGGACTRELLLLHGPPGARPGRPRCCAAVRGDGARHACLSRRRGDRLGDAQDGSAALVRHGGARRCCAGRIQHGRGRRLRDGRTALGSRVRAR